MKPEKENHPGNKLKNTSTESLPLHHCWHPFATILFSPANPRKHWSQANKPILAPPYPLFSLFCNLFSCVHQDHQLSRGRSRHAECGQQLPHHAPHYSDPKQRPAKGNYLESPYNNNTCMGCHLLDLNLFLSPHFRETPWQNLSQHICYWGPGHDS